ncbi:MAG TPA: ACT domain-containing protein [Acidimicrobiales bacterium]|jgi:[protein-PII] uridylyltransferase|nr:ACT domain-containing protein [Acidimicrobiales bacterium]
MMASSHEVGEALALTSMPAKTAGRLLAEAPDLWLMSAPSAALLASDLALCHPVLARREVRARAVPVDYLGSWRITVAAADRPGLLADTAAVMAAERLGVRAASAVTFSRGLALHSLTVEAPPLDERAWEQLADRIRAAALAGAPRPPFAPSGAAEVMANGTVDGRTLLTVEAVDQIGLLTEICRAMADQGVSIEVAHVVSEGTRALDSFVVRGPVDVDDLADRLSQTGRSRLASTASGLAGAIPVVGGLVRRGLEAVI